MSPISLEEKLDIDRVAIIGAGACGLACAKYLIAEKKFSQVKLFEQRPTPGGLWNYTATTRDDGFSLPRTTPTSEPDQVIRAEGSDEDRQIVSPVYDFLETNIPHVLMNYNDQAFPPESSLFPPHRVVLRYLQDYAAELERHISFETQVSRISKVRSGGRMCWEVETLDLKTGVSSTEEFDAVVVASGHYNDPFVPDIPGLVEFDKEHPGAILHSKFYRRPEQFQGKKVIIVGASASGIDLSAQISDVANKPILISEKSKATAPPPSQEDRPWARHVPEIVEFLPGPARAVRFSDGRTEAGVDAVVFCTGYHYAFPFLRSLTPEVVVRDGSHAAGLWEHVLYAADPTLAFLGIPQRIVPFPVAQAQSAAIARIWSDRMPAPTSVEMNEWVNKLRLAKGDNKAIHNLAFPADVDYINRLHDMCQRAKTRPGLENDGAGKRPPYWGEDKAWTRERFPMIKLASRALGDRRHKIRTLKELGFDYQEWKEAVGEAEKIL